MITTVVFVWKGKHEMKDIKRTSKDVELTFGPRREKTCLRGFATNTGADQPAHTRSLISAFVIHFL